MSVALTPIGPLTARQSWSSRFPKLAISDHLGLELTLFLNRVR
jgi:hypothetical protein